MNNSNAYFTVVDKKTGDVVIRCHTKDAAERWIEIYDIHNEYEIKPPTKGVRTK